MAMVFFFFFFHLKITNVFLLAIWDEPPAEDEPELYVAYKLALERYIRATKVKPPQKMKQLIADIRRLANAEKYESHELKAQPRYIEGGVLMQHQLEALK